MFVMYCLFVAAFFPVRWSMPVSWTIFTATYFVLEIRLLRTIDMNTVVGYLLTSMCLYLDVYHKQSLSIKQFIHYNEA
jgi:hypothetical protein